MSQSAHDVLQRLVTKQVGSLPFFDIIDALPTAIYTTDAKGKIDIYNKAAVELWGREPDCTDERWCGSWKLFHPDGRPMPHDSCPMAEALKTGDPVRGREAMAERPDGTRVHFIPYPTPIKDNSGTVIGAINMLVDITERKKSEETLASSEARLRDFVENTTIALRWVGPDSRVIWANQAEMDLLGYTPEEYIGHHISEFHAEQSAVDDFIERLGRFETLRDYEARLKCKDGSIRHVLIDTSVYAENGKFVHTRCFTKDITSQKFAEQRLVTNARISQILSESSTFDQAFEEVLKSLSEYFDADIAEIWLEDGALECCAFHSRLTGKSLEAFKNETLELKFARGNGLPGTIWQEARPVWLEDLLEDVPFVRRDAAAELGLGSGFGMPIFSRRRCRGAITFFTRNKLVSDNSLLVMMSSIGHKLGQFIDRIDQQRMNEHLAAVIEASQDAVVIAGLDDVITSWNKGAERLFGFTAEETIGSHTSFFVPKRALAARRRRIERLQRGKMPEPYETTRRHKSGRLLYVSLSYSPVYDPHGKLVAVAAIIRDITKRKLAERQLQARILQLQAISEIGITALASDDLEAVFGLAVSHLAEGLNVEYAKVLQLRPQGDLLLTAGVGWRDDLVGKKTVGGEIDSQAGYTLFAAKPVIVEDLKEETRFSGSQLLHDHGVVSGLSTIIRGEGDSVFGVLGAYTKKNRNFSDHDVHFLQSIANILTTAIQKKSYQESQLMLRRELSHRVKNNMTVVQAIARIAAQQSDSIEKFIESFEGRIAALAQSHDMLIASNWTGTSLAKLQRLVLGTQADGKRVKAEVKDIKLDAETTQAMTMVIYELMTNASKYGALSNDSGVVTLTGRLGQEDDTPVYHLVWCESGGPPVAKPKRSGYGTKLLKWTVQRKCEGKLKLDWRHEGLTVDITLPLSAIT